jgi:hypothetical protein
MIPRRPTKAQRDLQIRASLSGSRVELGAQGLYLAPSTWVALAGAVHSSSIDRAEHSVCVSRETWEQVELLCRLVLDGKRLP